MSEQEQKGPKERILKAASTLIAQRGYADVGVREISSNADVNIAMISYYFGNKIGILKAIIAEYFKDVEDIFLEDIDKNLSKDEIFRKRIRSTVNLIRRKTDICKVAMMEMPYDVPEIREFKIQMMTHHIEYIKKFTHRPDSHQKDKGMHLIIGPAYLSLIYSNFIFGDLINSLYKIDLNDEFYDKYSDTIATIFLRGVKGLMQSSMPEHQNKVSVR